MRNEDDAVIQSLAEAFRIGHDAGATLMVSHLKCVSQPNHKKSEITLAMIEEARKHQSVSLDAYPYGASSTILQPERVAKFSWVMITWSDPMPDAFDRDLSDIAREMGCSDEDAVRLSCPAARSVFRSAKMKRSASCLPP